MCFKLMVNAFIHYELQATKLHMHCKPLSHFITGTIKLCYSTLIFDFILDPMHVLKILLSITEMNSLKTKKKNLFRCQCLNICKCYTSIKNMMVFYYRSIADIEIPNCSNSSILISEQPHDITCKMTWAPCKDLDQHAELLILINI